MFANNKTAWVPFALSHCPSGVCDAWEKWLLHNPPPGGDDIHKECFTKFMREMYNARESDASNKARINNLKLNSCVPEFVALQEYILKLDEMVGKLKEELSHQDQMGLFVNNLPKILWLRCKAIACVVPTNDLAQMKLNAKNVNDKNKTYGDDLEEPDSDHTRWDDRNRFKKREHSLIRHNSLQHRNVQRGNAPPSGCKRPFGQSIRRFFDPSCICSLRNHTTTNCFRRACEQRENNNGAKTSSYMGNQGYGRPC